MGWAAILMAAVLLSDGQAMARACLQMPGAKLDPALDASAANQSYGRLFPEFKSKTNAEQVIRKLPIDRLVGKRLQLAGGAGEVWLALTQDGSTEITARSGGDVARHTVPAKLAGLDNAAYNGKLARTFFSLGISWKDFAVPVVPAIDFTELPASPTIAGISTTSVRLKGTPRVHRDQTIEYACSSEAVYVGDPAQLSTVVVLKGTIRATQLTTTTTTDTVLDLTINDVVEQQTVSYSDLVALLGGYPEIAQVLDKMRSAEAVVAAQTPATTTPNTEPGAAEVPIAAPVASANPAAPTPVDPAPVDPDPEGGFNWMAILGALAALCAIVLGVLYLPRFTAHRQRDTVPANAQTARKTVARSEVQRGNGAGEAAVSKPEAELTEGKAAADPMLEFAPRAPRPQAVAPQPEAVAPQPEAVAAKPDTAEPEPAAPPEAAAEPQPKVAAAAAEPEPKIVAEVPDEEAEPKSKPEPQAEPEAGASATGAAEPQATPVSQDEGKSLEARIAVLETLRIETETFQEKLNEAVDTAAREAENGRIAKQKLADAESRLAKLTEAKSLVLESAQNDRAKLNAAQQEARDLKEQVIDLRTRLAKANAQIESSVSIIGELESASRLAIELNADYRTKTKDSSAENRAMRSRVELLESALAERDELLQSTNQMNEEISRALLDERTERASIEDDFNALSKDHERLQQTSSNALKQVNSQVNQTVQELEASRELIASLEGELERAYGENKQMQLDHHARQTENARLRVDYGVRTRLLENNLQEMSAHVETLEQKLREAGMAVPSLELTPIEKSAIDDEPQHTQEPSSQHSEPPHPVPARNKGDVLHFRAKS